MNDLFIYRDVIRYFELAAALAGLYTWHKWRDTGVQPLIIYLLIVSVCKFLIPYKENGNRTDIWVYDAIIIPCEIPLYCWLYCQQAAGWIKRLALWSGALYIGAFATQRFFEQPGEPLLNSYVADAGRLAMLVIVMWYGWRNLWSDGPAGRDYRQRIMFWITTGCLLFYAGALPMYWFYYRVARHLNLTHVSSWVEMFFYYTFCQTAIVVLNSTMYIFFIIGFFKSRPGQT